MLPYQVLWFQPAARPPSAGGPHRRLRPTRDGAPGRARPRSLWWERSFDAYGTGKLTSDRRGPVSPHDVPRIRAGVRAAGPAVIPPPIPDGVTAGATAAPASRDTGAATDGAAFPGGHESRPGRRTPSHLVASRRLVRRFAGVCTESHVCPQKAKGPENSHYLVTAEKEANPRDPWDRPVISRRRGTRVRERRGRYAQYCDCLPMMR
ncbi:hypothetical protein Ssi03_54960 [Sphaerisporangium siamense]|nr:hypothetical protein Ssi03_54960 [Sphaerisporangium siamense]